MIIHFFKSPSDLRSWFEKNHEKSDELWVGYYKRATGKESLTWNESVEEALCFGWIDGIRMSVDEASYTIRFTRRKLKSTWSRKNISTAEKLISVGKMKPSGLAAFQKRKEDNSGIYSFEQEKIALSSEFEHLLKENTNAWTFFSSQAAYYQRTVTYWIMSAKQEKTRLKRLLELIADSENKQKIKPLRRTNS